MRILKSLAIFIPFVACIAGTANAGLSELELGVTYKTSHINQDNYNKTLSYTGSFSYYFWEMSALELSYTEGTSEMSVDFPSSGTQITYQSHYKIIGLDFVFTLAKRSSFLIPYLKGGIAHVNKKLVREASGGSQGTDVIETPDEVVPSGGIGIKLKFSKTFSLKFGFDTWPSAAARDDDSIPWDIAGRAGIVWML